MLPFIRERSFTCSRNHVATIITIHTPAHVLNNRSLITTRCVLLIDCRRQNIVHCCLQLYLDVMLTMNGRMFTLASRDGFIEHATIGDNSCCCTMAFISPVLHHGNVITSLHPCRFISIHVSRFLVSNHILSRQLCCVRKDT